MWPKMIIFNYNKQTTKHYIMSKKIENYLIRLTGSLITINYKGELLKAYDVKPLYAVEDFNRKVAQIQNMVDMKV